MAPPSIARHRCFPLLLRLFIATVWLLSALSAPGQYMTEILPSESPAPQAAPSAPESSTPAAAAQETATVAPAAACDPCPPLPAPAEVNQPSQQAPGDASPAANTPSQNNSNEPPNTDPPNVKKARFPTSGEWAQLQDQERAARGSIPNDFSDRPAWALTMGDSTPTEGIGQAAPRAAGASAPWNVNHQAQPMVAANERIVETLVDDLNVQAYTDAHHKPPLTAGLCRLDWESVLSRSGISLPAQDILFHSSPAWRKNHGIDQAYRHGDLAAADPNWVDIPPNEIQSGDTFFLLPYESVDSQHHQRRQHDAHIGFAVYSVPGGRWVGVSTNVNGNPRWTVVPLESFPTGGKPIRFFRWIGPIQPKSSP